MAITRILGAFALGLAGGMALRRRSGGRGRVRAGRPLTLRTRALVAGAAMLQRRLPLSGFHVYMVGFHPVKDDPERQWEAHHYCRQVNEDLAECVLFDGGDPDADLVGVEFIISERLFQQLPPSERPYWHPHNGEILSGLLVAPGLPERAERAMMRDKMNSYGKTWHVWDKGLPGQAPDPLPLGPPRLAWAFNRSREVRPELLARFGFDISSRHRKRRGLARLAHPQEGVKRLPDATGIRPSFP